MQTKELKKIIRQLKTYKIHVQEVPEEFKNNIDIIRAERRYGLRKSGNRGFDVINQEFFVEEIFYKDSTGDAASYSTKEVFDDFETYYNFLEGDIYVTYELKVLNKKNNPFVWIYGIFKLQHLRKI